MMWGFVIEGEKERNKGERDVERNCKEKGVLKGGKPAAAVGQQVNENACRPNRRDDNESKENAKQMRFPFREDHPTD